MTHSKNKIVRTTTWSPGPGCHGGCGVLAHIKDGKLVKIEGDPDHPMNQGRLCPGTRLACRHGGNPGQRNRPKAAQGKVLPHLPFLSHGAVYSVQTPHKTGP